MFFTLVIIVFRLHSCLGSGIHLLSPLQRHHVCNLPLAHQIETVHSFVRDHQVALVVELGLSHVRPDLARLPVLAAFFGVPLPGRAGAVLDHARLFARIRRIHFHVLVSRFGNLDLAAAVRPLRRRVKVAVALPEVRRPDADGRPFSWIFQNSLAQDGDCFRAVDARVPVAVPELPATQYAADPTILVHMVFPLVWPGDFRREAELDLGLPFVVISLVIWRHDHAEGLRIKFETAVLI